MLLLDDSALVVLFIGCMECSWFLCRYFALVVFDCVFFGFTNIFPPVFLCGSFWILTAFCCVFDLSFLLLFGGNSGSYCVLMTDSVCAMRCSDDHSRYCSVCFHYTIIKILGVFMLDPCVQEGYYIFPFFNR